jgi:hypothetical protein
VVFATFDLEESRNCQYDSLSFYNGSVVDENKLVKRICGNAPEQQPIKLHSQVMIHLKTDTSVVGKGFKLKYQAVYCKDLPPCGQTLTGVQGLVTSPGFPSSYPDRENCYIHIRVPYVCRARVEFMAFDLEYQVTCNYDSLEVFDGYTTDYAKSIGKYCGNSIPTNLTSSTNELLLHFVSDGSVAQSGFKGRYTAGKAVQFPSVLYVIGMLKVVSSILSSTINNFSNRTCHRTYFNQHKSYVSFCNLYCFSLSQCL